MNQRQRREDQAGLSIPKQYYQFLWCIFWAFICWKLASASCDRSCCDVCFSVVNSTNNSTTTNSTSTSACEIIILPGRCSSPDQEIKVSLPLYYTTQTNRHSSHPAHPHHPSQSTNNSTPPSTPPPTSSPSPSPSTKSRAAYYRISPPSRHRNMQHIRMRYTSICRFCPAGRCFSLRTRTRAEGSWIQRTRLCGNSIPLTNSRRRRPTRSFWRGCGCRENFTYAYYTLLFPPFHPQLPLSLLFSVSVPIPLKEGKLTDDGKNSTTPSPTSPRQTPK